MPAARIHLALRPTGGGLGTLLAETAETGFSGVEIGVSSLGVVFGGRLHAAEAARVTREVRASGLAVSLHAPLSLNLMDDAHADTHAAVAATSIDIGGLVGASVLVVHPGWLLRSRAAEEAALMAREAEGLARLADLAAQAGMTVALENMPTVSPKLVGDRFTYGNDPARIAAMVRDVGHPALTCCLDVSHAAIAAATRGSDLAADIRAMAPDIGHLHLHDSFGLPPSLFTWVSDENDAFGQGDLHLPLGWGSLDFDRLLTGLAVRPNPILTLEIMPHHQRPDTLADSLAQARRIATALAPAA